MERELFK